MFRKKEKEKSRPKVDDEEVPKTKRSRAPEDLKVRRKRKSERWLHACAALLARAKTQGSPALDPWRLVLSLAMRKMPRVGRFEASALPFAAHFFPALPRDASGFQHPFHFFPLIFRCSFQCVERTGGDAASLFPLLHFMALPMIPFFETNCVRAMPCQHCVTETIPNYTAGLASSRARAHQGSYCEACPPRPARTTGKISFLSADLHMMSTRVRLLIPEW